MKRISSSALFALAFAGATVSALHGCSSDSPRSPSGTTSPNGTTANSASSGDVGTVAMQLTLAPGTTLSTVQYTFSNPTLAGFNSITSTVDVSGSDKISFVLTLPAGTGYSLSLTATDSKGDPCSGGPLTFAVVADQNNPVSLNLVCTQTIDAAVVGPDVNIGTVAVTGDVELETVTNTPLCAAVSALGVSPAQATVGQTATLSAAGLDANDQSSDVTLTWTATGGAGTLADTTGTSNTFSCSSAGTETITVTATMTGGGSCPTTGSRSTTISCTSS
jgi:hypothetical protein